MTGTATRRATLSAMLVLALAAPMALAQVRTVDADFTDWCFASETAVPDTKDELTCLGTNGASTDEVVWYDAVSDNLSINDLAIIATTQDENFLYFIAVLANDPAPESIPSAQIAIDVAPGGLTIWHDSEAVLDNPNVGADSNRTIEADYMLVFDFANFLLGGADNAELREETTNPGSWTPIKFLQPAIFPGEVGGAGGDPGAVEIAIPWSDFSCQAGCPAFGPGDEFSFTLMIAQGDILFPFFTPAGPIEDVISEATAGTFTATQDSCATPGTTCELTDLSSDAYVDVNRVAVAGVGRIPDGSGPENPLTLSKVGADVLLDWDASCLGTDVDYGVYEGDLANPLSAMPETCTTAGLTERQLTPGAGNRFFLVVPTDTINEGSYGTTSAATERPVSLSACAPQQVGTCPN